MSDWIPYEQFVDDQVAAALAWLDECIDEVENPHERAAMLRQRPRAAAKLEAQVRMAYAREPTH